ncbi:MAG: hypothetical protein B6D41_12315 [Chloroflexi bacterium UTCFX4]|jgi:hypothetical protein|nr:MAG: hypothetical protein B6D41_12315 [Chloroflexi bacterium UTCFX4]
MKTLQTRVEQIETTLRETAQDDWFEIVKAQGVERAQITLAARGMTTELETLRAMLAEAHAEVERWERENFGANRDA